MKSSSLLFLLLVGLSGCAVVPPSAYTFDATRPQPKPVMPAAEATALTSRVAQLQSERVAIRDRIAVETDIWKRQSLYADLHRVGSQLSPLERRLASYSQAR